MAKPYVLLRIKGGKSEKVKGFDSLSEVDYWAEVRELEKAPDGYINPRNGTRFSLTMGGKP